MELGPLDDDEQEVVALALRRQAEEEAVVLAEARKTEEETEAAAAEASKKRGRDWMLKWMEDTKAERDERMMKRRKEVLAEREAAERVAEAQRRQWDNDSQVGKVVRDLNERLRESRRG